jgi:O-antigen ligase
LFAAGMTAAAILFVAGTVVADSSSIAARLVNPRNLFSRVVSWQASARMALDSPVLGVGLWNFTEVFERQYSEENFSAERALNTRIAVGPHSNLVWVATELGFAGFAPYVAANVLLLLIGWRALGRARAAETRARAACFIALFAAYWIPGLVLASGAYSDLNLCFFFLLGLLSRPLLASASE